MLNVGIVLALLSLIATATGASTLPRLWPAGSLQKIGRDQPLPTPMPQPMIELFAARGEHQSAQIVISAGKGAVKSVRASTSSLLGPNGAVIPASAIEIDRVAYIDLVNQKKIVPDPLPPAMTFDVEPGMNQPLWIGVDVPRDAKAGRYQGAITIRSEGNIAQSFPIELCVWDFTLPVGPSSKTAVGLSDGSVAVQEGLQAGSLAHRKMMVKYWRFLIERWVSPYQIPVSVTSDRAADFINDPRCTGFTIPYSDNVEEMRASVESLRKRNLLGKAYFYPTDEPSNKDQYEILYKVCRNIHAVDPKLRIVSPYYRDPEFESDGKTIHELADGYLNIWCPNIDYFNGHKERLYAKLAKGEEFWWYVCCGPGEPYPNFFMEMAGPSHRALPWLQWKYRCQGLLYWNTTYWETTKDPWVDMATVKWIRNDLYGDGSLLYPGKKVGVDGPVGSIRLELLRQGLQDYEYLVLLEKKIGREKAEKIVPKLITSPTEFSRDPAMWAKVRGEIGEILSH